MHVLNHIPNQVTLRRLLVVVTLLAVTLILGFAPHSGLTSATDSPRPLSAPTGGMRLQPPDIRMTLPIVMIGTTNAVPLPFLPADTGCPRAHCDQRNSDWVSMVPPGEDAAILWHDIVQSPTGQPMGSSQGLGCSSNGTDVACTFGRVGGACAEEDTLIVYGYDDGTGEPFRRWDSDTLLNCTAYTSAPLIGLGGSVVAADDEKIVRFGPSGTLLWIAPTPGGRPTSPVLTDDGRIVVATFGGPISLYTSDTGVLINALDLSEDGGRYVTSNTPAVRGNRLYVISQHSEDETRGRLYAIDIVRPVPPAQSSTLQVAWYLD
ncbi:MAG: hypothetical protein ACRDIB_10870, partial [Ardenticatenaceae bacterium]